MRSRLTPYGRKCRGLRDCYDLVMADQSKGIGVSVASISESEAGKRPIPFGYTSDLIHWLSLSDEDANCLRALEAGEVPSGRVSPQDSAQSVLELESPEDLAGLSREGLKYLRAVLAAARSAKNPLALIRQRAMLANAVFNSDMQPAFDVLGVVENKLRFLDEDFSLQVDQDRAGQPPIYSDSNGKKIDRFVSSQWFYNEASLRTPASRFKLAHEIGHLFLHPHNSHAYSRNPGTGRIVSKYVSIELEADEFAREFLLPLEVVERFTSPETLAKGANVQLGIAKRRIADINLLSTSERERIRSFARDLSDKLGTPFGLVPSSDAVSGDVGSSKMNTELRARKRRKAVVPKGMTLFEYADRLETARATRSDVWFRRFGFRG